MKIDASISNNVTVTAHILTRVLYVAVDVEHMIYPLEGSSESKVSDITKLCNSGGGRKLSGFL